LSALPSTIFSLALCITFPQVSGGDSSHSLSAHFSQNIPQLSTSIHLQPSIIQLCPWFPGCNRTQGSTEMETGQRLTSEMSRNVWMPLFCMGIFFFHREKYKLLLDLLLVRKEKAGTYLVFFVEYINS
jgi:hypothetical protein